MRHSVEGPEEPTIFERFASRLYLPYSAVCLILAIIPGYGGSNFGQSSLSWVLWTVLAFYMFYVIRYMRLRVLDTEAEVIPLCPEGEETFREAFGRLSRPLGQVLAMLVIGIIAIFYFFRLFSFADFFHLAFAASTVTLFSVAWGSVFWVYLSSLTGVRDLGKNPLRLKSCFDDTMLGFVR